MDPSLGDQTKHQMLDRVLAPLRWFRAGSESALAAAYACVKANPAAFGPGPWRDTYYRRGNQGAILDSLSPSYFALDSFIEHLLTEEGISPDTVWLGMQFAAELTCANLHVGTKWYGRTRGTWDFCYGTDYVAMMMLFHVDVRYAEAGAGFLLRVLDTYPDLHDFQYHLHDILTLRQTVTNPSDIVGFRMALATCPSQVHPGPLLKVLRVAGRSGLLMTVSALTRCRHDVYNSRVTLNKEQQRVCRRRKNKWRRELGAFLTRLVDAVGGARCPVAADIRGIFLQYFPLMEASFHRGVVISLLNMAVVHGPVLRELPRGLFMSTGFWQEVYLQRCPRLIKACHAIARERQWGLPPPDAAASRV